MSLSLVDPEDSMLSQSFDSRSLYTELRLAAIDLSIASKSMQSVVCLEEIKLSNRSTVQENKAEH